MYHQSLVNTIIIDIFFELRVFFFSYDNICKVNSNKEIKPSDLEYYVS